MNIIWIFFLLHLISFSLVLEVIVITRKEIQKMLNLDTKMKLDFVCISDNMDMGTADSLRHIHQKIKVLLSFIELTGSYLFIIFCCCCVVRSALCNDTVHN